MVSQTTSDAAPTEEKQDDVPVAEHAISDNPSGDEPEMDLSDDGFGSSRIGDDIQMQSFVPYQPQKKKNIITNHNRSTSTTTNSTTITVKQRHKKRSKNPAYDAEDTTSSNDEPEQPSDDNPRPSKKMKTLSGKPNVLTISLKSKKKVTPK